MILKFATSLAKKVIKGNLLSSLTRKFLNVLLEYKILDLRLSTLIELNLTMRPNYIYCLYHSAILARSLDIKKISIIEFGVAGGNGISFLESYQQKVFDETGVSIEIYGFDLGSGLSRPKDYRDLPYWFKENLYQMNFEKLNYKIRKSKLIIGDVKNTLKNFFKENNPAPIGAIFNDLDYYTSTKNSFEIFNGNDDYYLPRVFCYFDDIIGTESEMYGHHNGQLLAIDEFNSENQSKKIVLNQNLIAHQNNHSFRYQIYYYHNFKHKFYNKFIFEDKQSELSLSVNLK